MSLKILFQDADLLVIEKPAGVVVNNSLTTDLDSTVQTLVKDFVEESLDEEAAEFNDRGGVVHRLDKDTSGVLLVARTPAAFTNLQVQFKDRSVHKVYYALAHGYLKEDKLQVNAPIARNPNNRFKYAVVHTGKPAETHFELIEKYEHEGEKYSLLKALPKTGRTHQIRVHLAALNNIIVGDPLYLSKKGFEQDSIITSRMLLHAYEIGFIHPTTKEKLIIKSELPQEFSLFKKFVDN